MDASRVLLGLVYLLLGISFLVTRSRIAARGRGFALIWLFIGVLLTANGALRVVQALSGD
jgi:hypothetical protein